MSLKRLADWPERLAAFLEEHERRPFAWGDNDCALFACNAVQEITGADLAADFRQPEADAPRAHGKYSTKEGAALEMMRQTDGGGLEAVCHKIAGLHSLEEILPRQARRGDIVLFESPEGQSLGIVSLDGWRIVGAGPQGLSRVPLREGLRAWRIG